MSRLTAKSIRGHVLEILRCQSVDFDIMFGFKNFCAFRSDLVVYFVRLIEVWRRNVKVLFICNVHSQDRKRGDEASL